MSENQKKDEEEEERGESRGVRRRRRTVSISARLTPRLHETLKSESEKQGISTSALITNILTKYVEWDRSVERFGFVTVGRHSFKTILDSASEETAARAGSADGEHMRDYIYFWRSKPNIEDFLSGLESWSKYGGIAEYRLKRDEKEETGAEYRITLYHELGGKWSIYYKNLIEKSLSLMFSITPKIEEMSENSITFSFSSSSSS